jgi:ABC-type spermidine/putrescine transport system permease subunit II
MYNAPNVCWLNELSTLYAVVVSLLAANFARVLNALGANQLGGPGSSTVNSAYAWLLTLNPIVVVIMGIIVFFAGSLAKWVGLIMIIVGIILFALPYVLH